MLEPTCKDRWAFSVCQGILTCGGTQACAIPYIKQSNPFLCLKITVVYDLIAVQDNLCNASN